MKNDLDEMNIEFISQFNPQYPTITLCFSDAIVHTSIISSNVDHELKLLQLSCTHPFIARQLIWLVYSAANAYLTQRKADGGIAQKNL